MVLCSFEEGDVGDGLLEGGDGEGDDVSRTRRRVVIAVVGVVGVGGARRGDQVVVV